MNINNNPYHLFEEWFKNSQFVWSEHQSFFKKIVITIFSKFFKILCFFYPELKDLMGNDTVTLATCGEDGQAHGRMVLFKGLYQNQFTFYTNYQSQKSRDISKNARVSMTFHFRFPPRQIRVEGLATKLPKDVSDAYWNSRNLESQVGAILSKQSSELANYDELVNQYQNLLNQHQSKIPRPDFWGGFGINPNRIEFWEGKANRVHKRYEFSLSTSGEWVKRFLYP